TNPSVLVDKTKSARYGLKTAHTDLVQEKPKTLDALPSLLHKVTDTLNMFATIVKNASSKATDKGVSSAGETNASSSEEEKNTEDADNVNLKQKLTTTTLPTTTSFQSPLFLKNKGKEVISSKDAKDEETKSDSEDDHANLTNSMVESSKQKKLKNFSFVTEGGEQIHFSVEKIKEQTRIEETLKAELAKQEVEKVKNELVDLMGLCRLLFLVVVGVVGIVVGKKRLGDVVEKFGYVRTVIEVVSVELQLVDRI
nr:hypothetical protein [Tanacetum cinerariifolium]